MRVAVILALLLFPVSTHAQSGGVIGIFRDPQPVNCFDDPVAPFVVTSYWVIHYLTTEAKASSFKVDVNWPDALILATDYDVTTILGDPYTGIDITYPGCQPMPYILARLNFLPLQPVAPCAVEIRVVANPFGDPNGPTVIDCFDNVTYAVGGLLIVAAGAAEFNCRCEIATEEETWGHVKALYR